MARDVAQELSIVLKEYKSVVDTLDPEPTYKQVETAHDLEKEIDALIGEVGWVDISENEQKIYPETNNIFKEIIEREDAKANYHSRKAMGAIHSILYMDMDEKSLNCLAGTEKQGAIEDYIKELISILGRSGNYLIYAANDALTTEIYADWLAVNKVYETAIKDMVIRSRSMKKHLSEKDSNFCKKFEGLIEDYERAENIEEKLKILKNFDIVYYYIGSAWSSFSRSNWAGSSL